MKFNVFPCDCFDCFLHQRRTFVYIHDLQQKSINKYFHRRFWWVIRLWQGETAWYTVATALLKRLKMNWRPDRQGRSQEGGRGNIKLVMIQSSQPVWSRREEPNLSESSLAGWAPALRLRCAQPQAVRARYASPQSPPAKLDSDKFDDSTADQTGGLIESWLA